MLAPRAYIYFPSVRAGAQAPCHSTLALHHAWRFPIFLDVPPPVVCVRICIERRSCLFSGRHTVVFIYLFFLFVIWYYMTEISVRNARSTHALGISWRCRAFVYTRALYSSRSQQLYACNTRSRRLRVTLRLRQTPSLNPTCQNWRISFTFIKGRRRFKKVDAWSKICLLKFKLNW